MENILKEITGNYIPTQSTSYNAGNPIPGVLSNRESDENSEEDRENSEEDQPQNMGNIIFTVTKPFDIPPFPPRFMMIINPMKKGKVKKM